MQHILMMVEWPIIYHLSHLHSSLRPPHYPGVTPLLLPATRTTPHRHEETRPTGSSMERGPSFILIALQCAAAAHSSPKAQAAASPPFRLPPHSPPQPPLLPPPPPPHPTPPPHPVRSPHPILL
eukprot:GHVU01057891.1.p2 GENE.GHVU01057891.1~~GHVU01057891.1.p2  ORF type:complete len:124 (+),score=19.82 GHVU01057891.1:318-689(+)